MPTMYIFWVQFMSKAAQKKLKRPIFGDPQLQAAVVKSYRGESFSLFS